MTHIEPTAPASLLVVDDEPELRSLLGEYFGRHGSVSYTHLTLPTPRRLAR